jgi:carbamoyltransferase
MAIPIWLREKLFLKGYLQGELKKHGPGFDWEKRLVFSEHHLSHAPARSFPRLLPRPWC